MGQGLDGQPHQQGVRQDPQAAEGQARTKQEAVYRKGLGLYTLRHTFQTIGDGARDPIATRAIMGHAEASSDMSAVYREGVEDNRLKAVTDHVQQWLYGTEEEGQGAGPDEEPAKKTAKKKAEEPPVADTEP